MIFIVRLSNLISCNHIRLWSVKPATYLAILYADRSENRERIWPLIDAGTLGDFLRRLRRFGISISFPDYNQVIFHFEKS